MKEPAPSASRAARSRRGLAAAAAACAMALLAPALCAQEKSPRPKGPVAALADVLSGTLQGSSPGNDLTIVSSHAATATPQLAKLDVRVTGTYQGDAVLLRGIWRISDQGGVVWLVFIPGVDSSEAARRFSDSTFSPTDLAAGCWAVLMPRGRAFEGAIRTFPNCRDAIQAGAVQSVEKNWSVRFGEDGVRFHDSETDETLSFARVPKK